MRKEKLRNRYLTGKVVQYLVMCILFCFCLLGGKTKTVQAESVIPPHSDWEAYYLTYPADNRKEMRIYDYKGSDTDIIIPASYEVNGVTYEVELTETTFQNEKTIEKVTFEPGVKVSSGNSLFRGCSNLKSVSNIPEGVTNCSCMFYGCTSLTSAPEIPEGVTDTGYMFYLCKSLTRAPELPEGITRCYHMFQGCENLISAPKKIPAGVIDAGDMFNGCTNLVTAPEISAGVQSCDDMFKGCTNLVNAPDIPVGVINCNMMFEGCTKLSGSMQVFGNPVYYGNMFFSDAAEDGDGLVIYCAEDSARSKMLNVTTSNTKIEVKPMSEKKDVITFDGNGGTSSTSSKEVYVYGTYGELPTASRNGYDFNGWFTEKTGGTKVEAGTKVTNTYDHTLYAQWTKKAVQQASTSDTKPASTSSQAESTSSTGGNGDTGVSSGAGRTVPHYDIRTDGGTWTGSLYYKADGTLATECFFCDGMYTYYLMNDGTPMKNRLTYHPNGVNLIYFDEYGHELFDQFQFCEDVQYTCYFNTYGYMYFSVSTFWNGNAYYMDATGRMLNNGWFVYDDNNIDIGYANADGSLMADQFSYDQWGRMVYFGADGRIAKGLITDGVYYYQMDENDGHLIGTFPVEQ